MPQWVKTVYLSCITCTICTYRINAKKNTTGGHKFTIEATHVTISIIYHSWSIAEQCNKIFETMKEYPCRCGIQYPGTCNKKVTSAWRLQVPGRQQLTCKFRNIHSLTYWGRDIMAAIFHTTSSSGFSENVWISINISLKFVPRGPINNIPTVVQVMAWRRPGDKPLSEPMMVRLPTHICVTRPQWVNMSTT